jgi:hypothetical protein
MRVHHLLRRAAIALFGAPWFRDADILTTKFQTVIVVSAIQAVDYGRLP